MLWNAAHLQQRGSVPEQSPRFGESYSMWGSPQRLQTVPTADRPRSMRTRGRAVSRSVAAVRGLSAPGNVLRIFERGGRFRPETGLPGTARGVPGRPRARLSNRGLGTENRTDPTMLGLQKTRLLDPTLNFLGTNDHPGDYRSSGCSACHVVYANDRSPIHSAAYAQVWQSGSHRVTPGPDDSQGGAENPISASFCAGQLDSDEPVHRLPYSSRHERDEQLHRIPMVGRRNRRAVDVSRAAADIPTTEEIFAGRRCSNPGRSGGAGPVV